LTSFGFHTIHYSPMFGGSAPVLDVIRLAADAGFDAIGVDLASVTAHGSVDDVAGAIHDAGLRCSDVLVLVPGADDDLSATARTLGRLAGAVGAAACIAAVAAPVPWDGLVASLGECASILADHGCRLAVEFTPYSALATVSEAKQLCGAIGWDRCGLVLDSLHFFRSGAPWDELAALDAGQIAVVQWDDVPAAPPESLVDESRNRRLLPGAGGLPLADLAAAVRATGWDGIVSAEILSESFRQTEPATAIPAAYAALTSPAAGWRPGERFRSATPQ
jgi:sugar phosphate isomerase/epimerase